MIIFKEVEFDEPEDENENECDATIEYFDTQLECTEDDLTDFNSCCMCEIEKFAFCAIPCGHMLCTFCIEEPICLKCNTAIELKVATFN